MPQLRTVFILAILVVVSTAGLCQQPKRVCLYATHYYAIGNVPTTSSIHFLELFNNDTFRWIRDDKPLGGSYGIEGFQRNRLHLVTADNDIISDGVIIGDCSAGSITFRWMNGHKLAVLEMCITSSIDWPPPKENCE